MVVIRGWWGQISLQTGEDYDDNNVFDDPDDDGHDGHYDGHDDSDDHDDGGHDDDDGHDDSDEGHDDGNDCFSRCDLPSSRCLQSWRRERNMFGDPTSLN